MTSEETVKGTDSVIIGNRVYQVSDIPESLRIALIEKLSILPNDQYVKPELHQIYNIREFEDIAEKTLSASTFSYYKTGAADEITLLENEKAYQRIYFKPRILNSVSKVSLKTEILGSKTDLPFYITAFAGSGLDGNDEAEKPLAIAAGRTNVIQMIPGLTPFPLKELVDVHKNNNVDQWYQIYVRSSLQEALQSVREAEESGNITTLVFTVDTAQIGRRETASKAAKKSNSFFGANVKTSTISADLNWEDLKKIRSQTKLKVVLKGIQTLEDSIKAIESGYDGIIISNHGGRQLDTARSSIEILGQVVPELKKRNLYHKIEILIDGGVRRGSDIVKAFALGAKGVGLGRPFLYALQAYGQEGVLKVIELLKEEVELTLRLLGLTDINDVDESYVDTIDLFRNRATRL